MPHCGVEPGIQLEYASCPAEEIVKYSEVEDIADAHNWLGIWRFDASFGNTNQLWPTRRSGARCCACCARGDGEVELSYRDGNRR